MMNICDEIIGWSKGQPMVAYEIAQCLMQNMGCRDQ